MKRLGILFGIALLVGQGCGYTLKATPPHGLRSIYVETFRNDTFEPALEIDLTNVLIDRFLFDGTLRVTERDRADAVLKGTLTQFIREPLRYTGAEEVQEYRLVLMTDISLWDNRSGERLWEEKRFVGDTSFFTSGASQKSEEAATQDAFEELARRIVDRVVEAWPE